MKNKQSNSATVTKLRIAGLALMCAGIVLVVVGVKEVVIMLSTLGLQSGEWGMDWSPLRRMAVWVGIGMGVEVLGGIVMDVARRKQRQELLQQSHEPVASGEALSLLSRLGITDKSGHVLSTMGRQTPTTVMATTQAQRVCEHCGKSVQDNTFVYCPYCAQPLPTPEVSAAARVCMYCGAALKEEDEECPSCGHKVVKNEQI